MNWQALNVATKNEAIEAVSDILLRAGAEGVQVDDSDNVSVIAYYEDDANLPKTVSYIATALDQLPQFGIDASPATISLNGVVQADWEDNWKQYYHAQRVTRYITVVPSWEEFIPQQSEEKPVIMDPKLAFGTGTHETTQLMVQALETVVRGGESVIDVGTGSGVLAVVAKHLGVASVIATDIDEMSVHVAKENLLLNPVAEDVLVVTSDLLVDVHTQPVDLIVANILADVIERLIPQTVPLLKPKGYFLVSGIYDAIAEHIESQLHTHGYKIIQKSQMGEWHSYIAQLEEY
ncbi:50S ribosomal protein L11 methyltransferase [Leuconostoc rapi]|uniref:50S ribosomal protein L11 methyltransferase n=1 Tax=Leuconostoc rapi TaxID=1406906 RepID=UPI001959624D|nr:50S ribosomal protein L11 methyltransferase [Leuconostoc rapi]MBM7434999.1 ribosomal protein L11 methyltransferase [Leuconostoc rapi]